MSGRVMMMFWDVDEDDDKEKLQIRWEGDLRKRT